MLHAVERIVWRLFQNDYSFASEIGHRITSALWKSRFRQQRQPFRGDSRGPGQSLEDLGGKSGPGEPRRMRERYCPTFRIGGEGEQLSLNAFPISAYVTN